MKRIRLFLAMVMLSGLLVLAVVWGSVYAPVVQPSPQEVETIWAIEDTRKESDVPLVSRLHYDGAPLAYDAQSNTFYCTLGMNQGDEWPQLHITAPDNPDVKLMFSDDYTYDWCADAVREGYSYQILTYTDELFSYADIVFTGLPLVMIHCEEEIGDLDVPMQVAVSSFGTKSVISAGNVHQRGNGSKGKEKQNLKVEFTRSEGGKWNMVDFPGLGLMDEVLLNPMLFDESLIRDRLSWEIYGEMLGEAYRKGFGARKTAYAEVFINDAYYGVYLVVEPMNEADELLKTGDMHLLTDSVYRTLPRRFIEPHRPVLKKHEESGSVFEWRYEPAGARQFAAMERYLDALNEPDDEAFIQKAQSCMDIASVVRYVLLTQAAGLTDNGNNNTYVWARHDDSGMQYQFAPWDMDMSWGQCWGDIADKLGAQYDAWRAFDLLDRIVALNVGGAADLMVSRWREWRQSIFTTEHIMDLISGYYAELSESGALVRNSDRWGLTADTEAYEFMEYTEIRFAALDRAMDIVEKRNGEVPAFLRHVGEDMNCYPIDVQ